MGRDGLDDDDDDNVDYDNANGDDDRDCGLFAVAATLLLVLRLIRTLLLVVVVAIVVVVAVLVVAMASVEDKLKQSECQRQDLESELNAKLKRIEESRNLLSDDKQSLIQEIDEQMERWGNNIFKYYNTCQSMVWINFVIVAFLLSQILKQDG